ncbi:Fur family transcriptional regulator [Brevundimonas sp. A19_0]|uniref:Fur family transcriptional regulator n=1 Tax=Brevundimonas sp. A19_0 TaxID=2821087 RepID=UPI001ADC5C20|nr:Fur family transcriptional regulator [Brevundimonas sp. A19_0]MBO9501963.1 transcriptional repressor [Brevundimonas sp. A19_0]
MGHACDHDHDTAPPDAASVQQRIAVADARCRADGERLTAPRRRVLELLVESGEPMKAYDLIARFGEDGQAAKPPTVYRALEFLERRGLAHRIASISAYVACAEPEADGDPVHAAAFLICDCCGATQEVTGEQAVSLNRAAATAGYVIDHTTIEAHGRCPACRA